MAYPSGSGTEVLRNTQLNSVTSTHGITALRWDGTDATNGTNSYVVPTNCIVTVLNITVVDQANAAKEFTLQIVADSVTINIVTSQSMTAYGPVFIWNDKFVLQAGDKLSIDGTSGCTWDVNCSFLFQDWT